MKPKEECIEAIKIIDKTILQLKSSNNTTRRLQGDKFADNLIVTLEHNKKLYIKELQNS